MREFLDWGMPIRPNMILRPNERTSIALPWRGSGGANYARLREICGERTHPEYDRGSKRFLVARTHTQHVLDALVEEYGEVMVQQFGNASTTCVEACWNANPYTALDCVCGCAGVNHGSGGPLGNEVTPGLSVHHETTEANYLVTVTGRVLLT